MSRTGQISLGSRLDEISHNFNSVVSIRASQWSLRLVEDKAPILVCLLLALDPILWGFSQRVLLPAHGVLLLGHLVSLLAQGRLADEFIDVVV